MSDTEPKGRHGGKRRGAGRPKKGVAKVYTHPEDAALRYLSDVAAGVVEPNRDRITAARACLPYQAPRQRAPVKSPRPTALQQKSDLGKQRAAEEDWDRKVIEIRSRLERKE